ncbi:glycosyltransferase [Pararhodobacter oceanensis]|uniref:Colanic acid biosynthesis glycosyltransferase WcaL n=1 Tax=Pararhodobacter oceanensis TaxID=2172121 RepID=A0A2T8HSD8_9RHOB|nr:glycosyltransferase [Pararhodobacter oceanensis]PVH28335.1 colanic acid biosynthesis glycosyltransferase WcaL [Pararhodobacter oceanensis]
MKTGYVLNTYPAPSHSFIRREMRALERRGFQIHRFAMRPFDGVLVDPADQAEAARTEYVLGKGILAMIWALFTVGLQAPLRMHSGLALALKTGWRSEAGVFKHLIYYLEAAYVARRMFEENIPHIHAHFGTNAATVAMLAGYLTARPYSFTVHGPEEFDKPAAIALPEKIARAEFVVAISSYGRSQLCRLVDYRMWPKIKTVHCGIEPEHYPAAQPMPESRPVRFVNIGRFAEQKGQLLLIDAMEELVKRGVNARLTLVGDGELRPALERAISHAGLGAHITLTGWLDEEGVSREIENAHALVLPSFAEGLPMVIMEAMVTARPVIATWIAGVPELMQAGKTGWLVPAGNTAALVEAMTELAATGDDRLRRMGTTGRARVLIRHNIDTEAAKLAGFFTQRPRTQPS